MAMLSSHERFDDLEEAVQHATAWVHEMRGAGATSAIRRVCVRPSDSWDTDNLRHRHRPLFEASYYHPEQGLTDADVYAARVHDWHANADRVNQNLAHNKAKYRLCYLNWTDEWGPKPTACPACNTALHDDNPFRW
ncbi:hypothetical protein NJB14197_08990 [Mycobacterium montefiorense]|uniref:Uncharacterized protein n=1 Tax=Mycobacterium montefiorense TaxID=154654 RepID=A0AA37UW43_9MYCO|nr:hypothetical protein MmonteBS_12180 [Mycobacterium montefiorense]GKU37753.1 hypothetical protein NJB14191_50990 [Mycobacterium montefiorense]GKU42711.1 hypothetical protein NJB14192_46940 [Mycobacterium montefiorense]GKU46413.1 hypothetical protein NJB14194_30320 [Mycobacterium montefiorense]GKU51004.1 hypothetical protein NJB14195_22500 [Mycobacterium montefiorense]